MYISLYMLNLCDGFDIKLELYLDRQYILKSLCTKCNLLSPKLLSKNLKSRYIEI